MVDVVEANGFCYHDIFVLSLILKILLHAICSLDHCRNSKTTCEPIDKFPRNSRNVSFPSHLRVRSRMKPSQLYPLVILLF